MQEYQSICNFIKICFIFCFLNLLEMGDAISMEVEGDKTYQTFNTNVKRSEGSHLETAPLISLSDCDGESHLYSFIEKHLVRQEEIPESTPRKILRFSGQGAAIVLGSLAGVPYFEVAQEAGGNNPVLRWGVGIINTAATSGTGAWSYFNLLKGLDPQSDEEKILLKESRLPTPGYVAAHGLGLVVAVPTAYMVSLYNTHKWLAGISYLLDYSLKTSGYLNFFKKVSAEKGKIKSALGMGNLDTPDLDVPVQEMHQQVIDHLAHKIIPALLEMTDDDRDHFIECVHQKDNRSVEKYLESLLNLSSPNTDSRKTPDSWNNGYPKIAFISGLSLSAVLNIFHNGICGYKAWKMVYDNPYFTIPMAALGTIPIFILEMQATIETGGLLYDAAYNRITGHPQPSLLQTLYPTFSRILPFACIPLAAVTAYVGRFMVMDILKEILPQEGPRLFFAIGGFMGPFLFANYANYTVIHDLLVKYQRSFGELSKKQFILLTENIEKLSHLMKFAPKEEIKSFMEQPSIQNLISALNKEVMEEIAPDQETDLNDGLQQQTQGNYIARFVPNSVINQ